MKKKLTMEEYLRMYPRARKRIMSEFAQHAVESLEAKIRERKRRSAPKPATEPWRTLRTNDRARKKPRRW